MHQVERRHEFHRDRFRNGLAGFARDEQSDLLDFFQNDPAGFHNHARALAERRARPCALSNTRATNCARHVLRHRQWCAANLFAGGRIVGDKLSSL